MHHPQAVANFFIKKAWASSKVITSLKVLKLTYIAHGWTLGFTSEPLINQPVVAWKYGPVIPILYHQFKQYGDQPITELAQDIGPPYKAKYSPSETALIIGVWINYGRMDGPKLSRLTHQKGTPWDQVWNDEDGSNRDNAIIDNETIEKYYKALIPPGSSLNG